MTQINGQQMPRDTCRPIFYVEPVLDEVKTKEAGRPIFTEVEFVKIIIPGSRNEKPIFRVNESHKKRWPEHYKAFKEGHEYSGDGTPLVEWPKITRLEVSTLNSAGIQSVEELADALDENLRRIGTRYVNLKHLAAEFISGKGPYEAKISLLAKENEELKERLAALEEKISAQKSPPKKVIKKRV